MSSSYPKPLCSLRNLLSRICRNCRRPFEPEEFTGRSASLDHPVGDECELFVFADPECRLRIGSISTQGLHTNQALAKVRRKAYLLPELVNDLMLRLPEDRRPALLHWEERLHTTIARSFEDIEEKQEASVEDQQGLGVPRRRTARV